MTASLIITTYNWKKALELVLLSVFRQSLLPREIIVADDGSKDGTDQLIRHMQRLAPVPLIHSWQKDKGFRAAKSRNRAISKACGEYLILIDGDMILPRRFLEDHITEAGQGFFIQAGRVLLSEKKTKTMLKNKQIDISFWDRGIQNRKNCIRSKLLGNLFSTKSKSLSSIRTCNFSFWKEDALAVNGFNEDFEGWGREDSEFAARLFQKGLKKKTVKFKAVGYHLYHPLQKRTALKKNDSLLEKTIKEQLTWCENGLKNFP